MLKSGQERITRTEDDDTQDGFRRHPQAILINPLAVVLQQRRIRARTTSGGQAWLKLSMGWARGER